MPRRANKPIDVFRYINLHGNDKSVCWEWTAGLGGRPNDKRPYFTIDGSRRLAYRIVYELVNGAEIAQGALIRHTCDNRICCNPDHLVMGTHQDNMNDMKERERHGLPHHTVRAIRRLLATELLDGRNQYTHKEIAERFGISRQEVTEINRGTVYQHVKEKE